MVIPPLTTATSCVVQHIAKTSFNQLLQKFAHLDSPSPKIKYKHRCSIAECYCHSPSYSGPTLVERRLLLPPATNHCSALLSQLGIARACLKTRDIRNRSLFGTLEKSTAEGASRVFMEKYYHWH